MMDINLENLKKSHYNLITAYYDSLNLVSNLPSIPNVSLIDIFFGTDFFQQERGKIRENERIYSFTRLPTLRFFISIFIEWHIKRKLAALTVIYSQLEQSINPDVEDANSTISWLKDAQQGTQKFLSTFSVFSSAVSFIKFLGVVVSGFLVAALSVNSIYNAIILLFSQTLTPEILSTLFIIAISLLYLALFLVPAYTFKRWLFCNENYEIEEDDSVKNVSVNYLENDLFNKTGRAKPYELPVDTLLMSVVLFVIAFTMIPQIYVMQSSIVQWTLGIIVFLMIISGIVYFCVGFKRKSK
jgi:hypothetical protein